METATTQSIIVTVPASSANLGAGFDALALALDLRNEFAASPADVTEIEVAGYGEGLPVGESNLFYRSFAHLYSLAGQPAPPLRVRMRLHVPPGRGLGSSATAVVGGLLAANAYLGEPFGATEILAEAVKLEHGGHADNVSASLLGGLVVNAEDRGRFLPLSVPFPDELRAVLFIPDFGMDTVQGRALMPQHYSREDAVFNISRAALFVAAITQKRYSLLRVAMEDRLHQPYRAQLFPLFPALIEAALESGALGACLSGGGSSVLAVAAGDFGKIADAMRATARSAGVGGDTRVVDIDHEGARVNRISDFGF